MNFQNIEYFLAVAEHGNFTKAARSLYISQQSLSENIKRLEEEIGTPLLLRGKKVTLTPAGECFYSGGTKILKTQDKMLREIAVITDTHRCKIVLGVPRADIPPMLPQVISVFTRQYPEYEIEILHPDSLEVPDLVFRLQTAEKGENVIPLITEEPFVFVVSKTLLQQYYGIHWEDICKQMKQEQKLSCVAKIPMLMLYENKHIHPVLESVFMESSVRPSEAFKSEDANLLTSLCTAGSGAFVGPQDYCRKKFGALLDEQTGTHFMFLLRTINTSSLLLTYPKEKQLNAAEKKFVKTLLSVQKQEKSKSQGLSC